MAATPEGTALTAAHRSAQLTLRSALIRDLLQVWKLFDPARPESYGEFMSIAEILIRSLYRDSSGLATVYYREFLEAEGIAGRAFVVSAPELAQERIQIALRSTGLAGTLRSLRLGYPEQAALAQGFVQVSGAASRLVLTGARETITATAISDGRVSGWIRATDGKPCAFCAMLASRGPAYRNSSESSAGFRAHDHCSCVPEPYYDGSAWPERNQQFHDLWNETTRGHGGRDAVNLFRAALEAAE